MFVVAFAFAAALVGRVSPVLEVFDLFVKIANVRHNYILGSNVKTTMIYTHVLNRGGRGVVSPLDR